MMIKAVIFDWGGVLIESPTQGITAYCAKKLGVPLDTYKKSKLKTRDAFIDLQKGRISESAFWKAVCSRLNVNVPKNSLWNEAFRHAYREKKEMFLLASDLHKRMKTALLSDTELAAVEFFREKKYDMFDVLVFSCMEGFMKPDKRIYEITLQRLDVQPQEAVFIDDKQELVNGAAALGIKGILFVNVAQTKKELRKLGI